MSNTHITQCPHCQATFKVQDQHLSAAGGKVRCGSCLEVFNALDSLVKQNSNTEATATPQAKTTPESPSSHTAQDAPSDTSAVTSKRSPFEIPDNTEESIPSDTGAAKNNKSDDDDELIFADNPDEDRQDESYTGPGTFSSELSDSFLEIDTDSADQFSESEYIEDLEDELSGASSGSDESWAEKMLEDIEVDKRKPPKAPVSPPSKSKTDMSDTFSDEFAAIDEGLTLEPVPSETDSDFEPNAAEPEPFEATDYSAPDYSAPDYSAPDNADLSHQYENLRIDPAEQPYVSERSFFSTFIWTTLNLGLLVVLLAQLAWFHYDKLAQYEQLRPLYHQACTLMGCKLPELVDTSKIRSQNLIVRSHPTARKALIIDAVIINQAPYEQPFPNLALYFSDLNNKVIAQRLFEPSEYLAGDITQWETMPIGSPIHISLEILDPGSNAVNYSVGFFKHTPPQNN